MARRFNRKPLTDEERDARRQADRERIEQAARALLTSDGWQRWIRVRASNGLSRYSLGNQMLIAIDCHARGITPTYVAGFRAFLDLNRCVRKGEKAIRILAPVAVKQRDEHGEETGEKKVFFRTVPVFDVSMTDPLARQGARPAHAAVAADHRRQPPPPDRPADRPRRASSATRVEIRDLPDDGPGGWCDPKRKQIVVATGPANRQVRTLVHELAHAHGLGYEQYGREQAEVLVDCVTYCVLGSVGLDVGGESIPYIAGWGEDGALDAIREYAQTIDTIARRIEDALDPTPEPATRRGRQPKLWRRSAPRGRSGAAPPR